MEAFVLTAFSVSEGPNGPPVEHITGLYSSLYKAKAAAQEIAEETDWTPEENIRLEWKTAMHFYADSLTAEHSDVRFHIMKMEIDQ